MSAHPLSGQSRVFGFQAVVLALAAQEDGAAKRLEHLLIGICPSGCCDEIRCKTSRADVINVAGDVMGREGLRPAWTLRRHGRHEEEKQRAPSRNIQHEFD